MDRAATGLAEPGLAVARVGAADARGAQVFRLVGRASAGGPVVRSARHGWSAGQVARLEDLVDRGGVVMPCGRLSAHKLDRTLAEARGLLGHGNAQRGPEATAAARRAARGGWSGGLPRDELLAAGFVLRRGAVRRASAESAAPGLPSALPGMLQRGHARELVLLYILRRLEAVDEARVEQMLPLVTALGAEQLSKHTEFLGGLVSALVADPSRRLTTRIAAAVVTHCLVPLSSAMAIAHVQLLRLMTATWQTLHALAAHVVATSLTTQTTGLVAADEQGALLGLEHALFAGARVIGPILGTSVFEHRRRRGMGFVAAVCAVVDVALALTLRDGSAKEAAEEEKTN